MATLLSEAGSYTGKTFAETTKSTYRTHLRTYLRFCIKFGLEPVPASQHTLIAYIAFLARTLKPCSINGYLNIVRIIHLESGLRNPLENNYAIHNLKKGIARVLGSPPDQKLPITCPILLKIKQLLCFCIPKDIVFLAC